ncbi:hypothetical protein ACN2XU_04980 [Primorskyibacter sp. 2E107]|uniref:hypothetical protein n=1 Tax=Primorskyibacter sp. 2E107 TaxID=3403458 RepID=UPI003AF89616
MRAHNILGLSMALLMTGGAVQAQEAYGNASGCARVTGQGTQSDDVAIFYPSDRLEFWESRCALHDYQSLGAGAVMLNTKCSGEGETWDETYFIYTTDRDSFILSREPETDGTELFACQ